MCVSLAPKRCRPIYVVQASHDSSSNQHPEYYSKLFLQRLTSRMRVRLLPELQQPLTSMAHSCRRLRGIVARPRTTHVSPQTQTQGQPYCTHPPAMPPYFAAASQTQDQPYCTYPSLTLPYFANAACAAHKDHLHEVNDDALSSTTLYTLGASPKSRKGSVIE